MRQQLLGIGFLAPAILIAVLFFMLPVLLTVGFSFTNMSTSTGIGGGEYLISQSDLRGLEAQGITAETVERLDAAGFQITEDGLLRFAEIYGAERATELRDDYLGDSFEARRDLERVLRDLTSEPIRNTRERKAAADLFAVSLLGERFASEAAFRGALATMEIPEADRDRLTTLAYTGWRWTSENFALLMELPSTWRYALNSAFYVAATLAVSLGLALFLAISTFYLPDRLAHFFRAVWFLPRILPPVMFVLIWNWFTWDTGFIATITGWFGVPQQNWMMQTPIHAWTVVILINGFVGASLGMILFASAIKAIPTSMLHASEVDGANRWQQVIYIMLPQMRWPILFYTCYQTLSLLTSFEYILLSTNGGPGSATETWPLAAFNIALNNYGGNLRYGLGSAFALVLVVIGIALSLFYLRLFNFKELVTKPRIEQ
ncbi:sugar ABC transporter permease [Gymnodinialimonas sp. 2305UL16-5]|uniref:carbohydrate ABC transporter permease n=1 Tax=Gymnodinialimonas mytili TaxID=3126503 RepID=UPI003099EA0B